jgi:hypothetical protein
MTALTFTQALIEAESLARKTLPSTLHERLAHAAELVRQGRVFQATDGTWQVDSAGTEGLTCAVNGACSCHDFHYNQPPQNLCKHRLAVYVCRKVAALLAVAQTGAPEPPAEEINGDIITIESSQPLYEAAASVNVRVQVSGHEVQWTLRDHDEARLAARLEALLQRYPLPPPAPAPTQGQGEGLCSVHGVQMKWNEGKEGRKGWYSHRLASGDYCNGRPGKYTK